MVYQLKMEEIARLLLRPSPQRGRRTRRPIDENVVVVPVIREPRRPPPPPPVEVWPQKDALKRLLNMR